MFAYSELTLIGWSSACFAKDALMPASGNAPVESAGTLAMCMEIIIAQLITGHPRFQLRMACLWNLRVVWESSVRVLVDTSLASMQSLRLEDDIIKVKTPRWEGKVLKRARDIDLGMQPLVFKRPTLLGPILRNRFHGGSSSCS